MEYNWQLSQSILPSVYAWPTNSRILGYLASEVKRVPTRSATIMKPAVWEAEDILNLDARHNAPHAHRTGRYGTVRL